MTSISRAYKRYVLGVLTLVYTLNYVDRGLITLLLPSIQHDLRLTDSQLGFLTGIAFGLFYATLGIPLARWADRGDRRWITAIAIGLWGLTVMSCTWVTSFTQLVIARIAAGVGEAGCMPPTYSLLGDYFLSPTERTRALSIYMLANPLSILLSFVLGSWVAVHFGWRSTFLSMGLPALGVAALVATTVKEPRRREGAVPLADRPIPPPVLEVFRALWRRRATRHLTLALIVLLTLGAGLGPWYGTFLTRYHQVGTAQLGLQLGLIFTLAGTAGIALGSVICTRIFGTNDRSQMRATAIAVAALMPAYAAFLLAKGTPTTLAALALLWTLFNFFIGPTFALLQRLVAADTRATSLAFVMMLANLIGMGLGPQLVGLLSDGFRRTLGSQSLRYAMLSLSFLALWAAFHFWRVGHWVRADVNPRPDMDPRPSVGDIPLSY